MPLFGAVFETQSFSPPEASKIPRWKVAQENWPKILCHPMKHHRIAWSRLGGAICCWGGGSKESTSPKKTGYFEIQDLGHQKLFEVNICLAIIETLQNIDKYFTYYHILIHWTQVGMNLPRNQRRYFNKGPSYYQPNEYIIQSEILQICHTFADPPHKRVINELWVLFNLPLPGVRTADWFPSFQRCIGICHSGHQSCRGTAITVPHGEIGLVI